MVDSLTWIGGGRPRLAGSEGPIEVKGPRLILAVIHERDVIVCAKLQAMLRKLLGHIPDESHIAANIAVQTRECATQGRIGVCINNRQHWNCKERVRKSDGARVCFAVTNGSLFFVPMPISGIGIDDPCRTGRVGVVQNNLKPAVIVGCTFVGPIAEEARRRIVLANPVRHTGEDSIVGALVPIKTPVELVVLRRTRPLREIVVAKARTGNIGLRIESENLLSDRIPKT